MLRAIREIQPTWVVGENVFGLVNWNGGLVFDEVQAELESEGYEVQPYVLPACAVNAPHRRDRIWFVAYAKGGRDSRTPNETSGETKRQDWKQVEQSEQRGEIWPTPHPDSDGQHGCDCEHEINTSKGGEYAQRDAQQGYGDGNAADTSHEGLEGRSVIGGFKGSWQKSNQQSTGCFQPAWQNFPTQSPVRYGDDGLSSRLDGITFSKWRNESIKAGGNAVVPQVVLQIFKAIEQYNKINP
jgi:DNA (cytosine-5)-methyltransferase 1